MNVSLPSPARLAAAVIHAVASEYRKIDAPPPAPAEPARQEISCVAASTQVNTAHPRRAYRDGQVSPPFGFGKQAGRG